MIMLPGGFSAGDEPDGSAKFFATAFQNAKIKEAVMKLLNERDGLALGICNGFQALIKLGLVPYGEICDRKRDSPTLTYNTIGRHISKMVYTKVVSNKSPWLQKAKLGGVYCNPASARERVVCCKWRLLACEASGKRTDRYSVRNCRRRAEQLRGMERKRLLHEYRGYYKSGRTCSGGGGRWLTVRRRDNGVAVNIYGEQDIRIFKSHVDYFK